MSTSQDETCTDPNCKTCQRINLCEEGKCKVCKEDFNIKKFRTTKGYIMGFCMTSADNKLTKYVFDSCMVCEKPSKIVILRFLGNSKDRVIHKREACTSCFIDSEYFYDDEIISKYEDIREIHNGSDIEHYVYFVNGKSAQYTPDLDLYPNHIITQIFFRPDLLGDFNPNKCTKKIIDLNKREWYHHYPPISGQYSA